MSQHNTYQVELTQSQMLMWAGQKLNPDAPMYNMILVFHLDGKIQVDAFQASFRKLVYQSDTLRTVFIEKDGSPEQFVFNKMDVHPEYIDISSELDREGCLKEIIQKRSQRVFDLSACLFDHALIKQSENEYYWYFNQHHLITDVWGVSVLARNMASLYQNEIGRGDIAEHSIPAFRDFIMEENSGKTNQEFETTRQFWKDKIIKFPRDLILYGQKQIKRTTRSERISLDLGDARSQKIRELSMEKEIRDFSQHLGIFNIFGTVLFTFLNRVSGQSNIVIGTPAHNRTTPKYKETPGVFIEFFPFHIELEEDECFDSLYNKIRLESHLLLRNTNPGLSTPELNKTFNVVLNYIHTTFENFAGIPMQSEWVHPEHCDPAHHLRLHVQDFQSGGPIRLHFDLNNAIYPEEIRGDIPGHFLKILDAFISDREQQIYQGGLLSDNEIEVWNKSFMASSSFDFKYESFVERFEQQVSLTPNANAIHFKGEVLQYQFLNQKVNQLAHFLIQKTIHPGSKVCVYMKRSPDVLISILAVLKCGATYIPIPSDYPDRRIQHILDDTNADLLLTHRKVKSQLPSLSMRIFIEEVLDDIKLYPTQNIGMQLSPESIAYIMYTSGSTGKPKGVMISNRSLSFYLQSAENYYIKGSAPIAPFFTSIGFDLTVTSLFLPLICGGEVHIYEEDESAPDLSLLRVIAEDAVNFIKLTPSHLKLIKGRELSDSSIRTMLVGGEDFQFELAKNTQNSFPPDLEIYNEYGPTEGTVGCIVHRFDASDDVGESVPIGRPLPQVRAYILDSKMNPVPHGVLGQLYISGPGLATGYWNARNNTSASFVNDPYVEGSMMYQTGDLARVNMKGQIEFKGREDNQVKVGGIRVELGEIEKLMGTFPGIEDCLADIFHTAGEREKEGIIHCIQCGLPSNYPTSDFNSEGVCALCQSFEGYQQKVQKYFKGMDELKSILGDGATKNGGEYDCMMLLSGGKDSSYALARLAELGLKVLAFTLDNGYISEQAKENIRRVVDDLGVDHVFGETPFMNEIFVDSLRRHSNVCNGCFKTIYTLSIQIALEKNIPFIVTGLSRGQFFETRLTEELFWHDNVNFEDIDQTILEARKAYHQVDDAVRKCLDVSIFENDNVFDKVRFVDFYRYCDVPLQEMYAYLDEKIPWIRPTDTGRSTNCLINQVGIYVHKKEVGYNNYAFPYSWDVRTGHKTREAALEEINEVVHEDEVLKIMDEIGYTEEKNSKDEGHNLVLYYVSPQPISQAELRNHAAHNMPAYMAPAYYMHLESIPLSSNGKVDREALYQMKGLRSVKDVEYLAPQTEMQTMIAATWSEVMQISEIGINDNFLHLGGSSLLAIRIISRINEMLELDIPVNRIFEYPTIATLSECIEVLITTLLEEFSDDE